MSTSNGFISLASPFLIPKTAPAAVLSGPYGEPYTILSSPVPRPGPVEALVRLSYSGVCHGDIYSRNGGGPAPPMPTRPLTGGHEGVGIIVALGDSSIEGQPSTRFRIGDTVGIAWRSSVCGTCEPCRLGAENHCTRQCVTGMHRDGTYQCKYCQLPQPCCKCLSGTSHAFTHTFLAYIAFPLLELVRIPPGANLAAVCPILCAGVTAYTSLRMLNPVPGKWCVIVGAAGGLGHLAIQYAKAMDLRVLAVDGGLPQKESFCMRMGADVFVDFTQGRLVETVRERTQGGADYALILSPHQTCYRFAISRKECLVVR